MVGRIRALLEKKPMTITYKNGDATRPKERSLIIHVCNNAGGWGAGFVLALSAIDKTPENDYREWAKRGQQSTGVPFELGNIQLSAFGDHIVVNMVAQDNIERSVPPIRYDALRECLEQVTQVAMKTGLPVVGPRFGAGIGGGEWSVIEEIINDTLIAHDIPVTIYTL